MEAGRRGELGAAEEGLDLDDFGNVACWEEEQCAGEAADGHLQEAEADIGGRPGQQHDGRAEGSVTEMPLQPQAGGKLDGLEQGRGDSVVTVTQPGNGRGPATEEKLPAGRSSDGMRGGGGRREDAGPKQGRASWLSRFLRQQPESYILHRRTNLAAMLALGALLALFVCLAVLDRHQTRCRVLRLPQFPCSRRPFRHGTSFRPR